MNESRGVLVGTIDDHYDSVPYTVNYYSIDHIVDDIPVSEQYLLSNAAYMSILIITLSWRLD